MKRKIFIVACTILLLGIPWKYLRRRATTIFAQFIKESVKNSTEDLYNIQFANMEINFLTGNIWLADIVLKPDTSVYKILIQQKKLPEYLCTIHASEFNIKKLNLLKLYFNRSIDLETILIDKPRIRINHQDKNLCKIPDRRSMCEMLSKELKSIQIKELNIQDLRISYIDHPSKTYPSTDLDKINIKLNDLLIDSLTQQDTTRLYHSKNMFVRMEGYEYETDDQRYVIRLDEISGSTGNADAKIIGLRIIPKYPEMEFTTLFQEQNTRYDMKLEEIILKGIDYRLLYKEHHLHASSLSINKGDIAIFLNRAVPMATAKHAQHYPSLALKNFNLDHQIDTVAWKDLKISYSEYNPKSACRGNIFFTQVDGKFENITNNAIALEKNKYCLAALTGLMMGTSKFDLQFKFDLLDSKGSFLFEGHLGKMNPRILNPALQSLALIKIKSGLVKDIRFAGIGDTTACSGNLTARYTDLRTGILKRDSMKLELQREIIASIYANNMLIRRNNPNDEGRLYAATFSYKNTADGSFFRSIWKGLSMGLMDNIGLGLQTQQHMKSLASQRQEQKIKQRTRKMNRKKRRMERQQSFKKLE